MSARLPAPVTIIAGRLGSESFRIGRDGSVGRVATPWRSFPRGAAYFPATGTWFMFRRGHLVVGRGTRRLWSSRAPIAPDQVGLIVASSRTIAFQHDHKLYVAAPGIAERPVANRELPLGFTSSGLYTYRYQGHQLLLRSDSGALLKTISRRPLGSDYLVANGSLYFIARGALMSANGERTQRLASIAGLGLPAGVGLQPLGRLLELEYGNRFVVLRPDGSVFARMSLPGSENISSALVVAPRDRAVAFAAAAGVTSDPNATQRPYGTETVYLLPAGAHAAVPVHTERVEFRPCERGAGLQWDGRWLLYSNSEGNLAAIDTAGSHRSIELTTLARSLPGTRDGFGAYWSGHVPEL